MADTDYQAVRERIAVTRKLASDICVFGKIAAARLDHLRGWERWVRYDPSDETPASSKPTGSEEVLLSRGGHLRTQVKCHGGIMLWRRVDVKTLRPDQLVSIHHHLEDFLNS